MERQDSLIHYVVFIFMALCWPAWSGVVIQGPNLVSPQEKASWHGHWASKAPDSVQWLWSVDDEMDYTASTNSVLEMAFYKEGKHWIRLKAKTKDGRESLPESLAVHAGYFPLVISDLPESLWISVNDEVRFAPQIFSFLKIVRYRWYFVGDRQWQYSSSDSGNASYTYWKTGVYASQFCVADSAGNQACDTVVVTVTDTEPRIQSFPDMTISGHDTVEWVCRVKDDGKRFWARWDFDGDGKWDYESRQSLKAKYRYPMQQEGKKTAQFASVVEIQDDDGHACRDTFLVKADFLIPKADAGRNTIVCRGDSVVYNGWRSLAFKGEIDLWEWDFNTDGIADTACRTGEIRRPAPPKPGTYPVKLWVVDEYGNRSLPDSVAVVVIEDRPAVTVDSTVWAGVGDSVWFSGRGGRQCGEIVEYAWDLDGDGKWEWQAAENIKIPYVYQTPGVYYSRFQITGDDGIQGSAIRIVRIGPKRKS